MLVSFDNISFSVPALRPIQSSGAFCVIFSPFGILAERRYMFYVELQFAISISLSLVVRLSQCSVNVQASSPVFIAIVFFF